MNNKFSWQSFISIGLLISFIVMLISGLILYVAPEGSLARWIGWEVFSLSKKQWEHQHTIFSYLFIVFTIFHIFKINWALLLSYFVPEKIKIKNYKELIAAIIICLAVFLGTLINLNPFQFIINLGDDISDSHANNVEMTDVSDAEKLTLKEFASEVFEIDYEEIKSVLNRYQFVNNEKNILVKDFCKENDITPEELYKILKGELIKESTNFNGFIDISSYTSFPNEISTIL